MRDRICVALLVGVGLVVARAQEPDILDAALLRPFGVTMGNGAPVLFGDPALDAAELALHDLLPRPWTVARIRPLFEAAAARFVEARHASDHGDPRAYTETYAEWDALVVHLGRVLAASRDPRGALALGRVLEGERFPSMCGLASGVLLAFGRDPGYQALPEPGGAMAFSNACPYFVDRANTWFELNRRQIETRAAALSAAEPPCTNCEQAAMETIDQLRLRLHATAPTLHLTVEGGGSPNMLQFEGIIVAANGQGGTRSMQRLPVTLPDVRIAMPGTLLGRNDLRMTALIVSPGYRTVVIDVTGTRQRRIPVTLEPLPRRELTGTVTFADGAAARAFVLDVDLRLTASNDAFGILSNGISTVQGVAEARVGPDGRFTLVVPDLAKDEILAAPGNRFVLSARGLPLVLEPGEISFDRAADAPLNVSASPRPRVPKRQ